MFELVSATSVFVDFLVPVNSMYRTFPMVRLFRHVRLAFLSIGVAKWLGVLGTITVNG